MNQTSNDKTGNGTNGASTSAWMANTRLPSFPPFAGEEIGVGGIVDVCVIGAGIGGLTTAYLLAQKGKQVVVIDAVGLGAGETGRTTAHISVPDEWFTGVEQTFGADKAKLVADSFAKATDLIENIVRSEQIDCAFERLDGYLYAQLGSRFHDLAQECAAARRAGLNAEQLERVPGIGFDTGPCVRYPNQATFHPLRYLAGLAEAIVRNGGRIFGQTRATNIGGDRDVRVVDTPNGAIRARAVVVATNTPFNNRVAVHTKQAGYRTYVVGLRIARGAVPHLLLWDTGDPYHYVRVAQPDSDLDEELLLVGGADHKVGQDSHPEHRYGELERWARERFPMARTCDYRWSGEIMEPADGAAYLGRNPMDHRNVYVITGDSGNGMPHCTIGAMLISDLISGIDNPWADLYDPARKALRGISQYVAEQANTLAQYEDWLTSGEVASMQEIAAGEGAIVRQGEKKLAVYRDRYGELHALSAKCTHLGCVVRWNSAEHSWDCPCHGSRFNIDGGVLHGPAAAPLAAANGTTKKSETEVRPRTPSNTHGSGDERTR
jgi:glycine/D-amino acid oxidase-like deaminating enzyme/nitrite reductase/ring-hydroxylating ferredoxin subunit